MRFLVSLFLPWMLAASGGFYVLAEDPGAWPQILSSVGFRMVPPGEAGIFVLRAGAAASVHWADRVAQGAWLILEGESSQAEWFGFRRGKDQVRVASLEDVHNPKLPIIWQTALEIPRYDIPAEARIFAKERWLGAPLLAGFRRGRGGVLWLAVAPGERGYERFPYLLQALSDLGLEAPFRAARLWAFFDSSYRLRADLDYLAARWRAAGIAALHVAAWHFHEPDAARDAWLRRLIEACHARGILVYCWLELPHVSEKFWNDHPEWREKTALLQDAQLDWRKLMNLANRDSFRAASAGVQELLRRFDWDGINLAELYFESLEGAANPSRFTPMNADVRARFREIHGSDPVKEFGTRAFLDFRAELAGRMQQEWIALLRRAAPQLDLVLTHVDDRFDRGMRDAIGADAASVLPLLAQHSFTFLIEDPATVWHLGPRRYPEIARRYQALTAHSARLGIDINVVERYQDVYPTRRQTGTELFQLVHQAAAAFPRVALYVESSIPPPDWKLLPAAAAAVTRAERVGEKLAVESPHGVGVPWSGAALVDGALWPVQDGRTLWLPAGAHSVATAGTTLPARILDFNGELKAARVLADGSIELAYQSASRALALVERKPARLEIDGVETAPQFAGGRVVTLPRGQHVVTFAGWALQ